MFEYLKRLVWASKICRKLGIKLLPVLSADDSVGRYYYSRSIRVALFGRFFYETFLHELAHHFSLAHGGRTYTNSYKNRALRATSYLDLGKDFYVNSILYEEARASRYALRMLRKFGKYSEISESYLLRCFRSYQSVDPNISADIKVRLADLSEKLISYLRNK